MRWAFSPSPFGNPAAAVPTVDPYDGTISYDWTGDTLGVTPPNNIYYPWSSAPVGPGGFGSPNGSARVQASALPFSPNALNYNVNLSANTTQVSQLINFPSANDFNIFTIMSYPSADGVTPRNMGFLFQGSIGAGPWPTVSKNGYAIWFTGTNLILRKYINDTPTDFTPVAFATTTGTTYGIRIERRSFGNTLKVKAWEWDAGGMGDEPSSWLIDLSGEASITTAGFHGPFSQRGSGEDNCHFVSGNFNAGGIAAGP